MLSFSHPSVQSIVFHCAISLRLSLRQLLCVYGAGGESEEGVKGGKMERERKKEDGETRRGGAKNSPRGIAAAVPHQLGQ